MPHTAVGDGRILDPRSPSRDPKARLVHGICQPRDRKPRFVHLPNAISVDEAAFLIPGSLRSTHKGSKTPLRPPIMSDHGG